MSRKEQKVMKQKNDIIQELQDLSCSRLASFDKSLPYSLPNQYFEDNLEIIGKVIRNENDSDLSFGKVGAPKYAIPDHYFENNINSLPSLVINQDQDFGKQNPFSIPEDYFDNLPSEILKKVKSLDNQQQGSHVIEFRPKHSKKMNWAIAASVALLISMGAALLPWNSSQSNNVAGVNGESSNELASLSKSQLDTEFVAKQLPLDLYGSDVSENSLNISAEDIADYWAGEIDNL